MGTANPRVSITVATRKGSGRTNQDRYIIGPNFAAVLDGASNFTEQQPDRDGGWYAETLAAKLRELLTAQPDGPLPVVVERAIESVATEHDLRPDTSPTSTIALARWDDQHVETYVLGDSTVAIIHTDGSEHVYSDDRLASIGGRLRRAYQERLATGSGFDAEHRKLLASLQAEQARARNQEQGYWIAGAEPTAGRHGMQHACARAAVAEILLASDGASRGVMHYWVYPTWRALSAEDPENSLTTIHRAESKDPEGRRWPRSKKHDDKTLISISV